MDNLVVPQEEIEALQNSDDLADFSTFRVPNNLLKKIGQLARDSYALRDGSDLEGLSKAEWTLIEEVITGFENR